MFETKLSRRPMNAHERVSWAASMGTAILLHAGLVALLLYFVHPPELVPSAGEVASWFDLGFSMPGGGGVGPGQGEGIGGRGGPTQPLHLVVPRIPRGVNPRAARGRSVLLLVEVRGNGSVGEARIDRPSGITALDDAALAAARGMRYRSRADTMPQWTRLEIRF